MLPLIVAWSTCEKEGRLTPVPWLPTVLRVTSGVMRALVPEVLRSCVVSHPVLRYDWDAHVRWSHAILSGHVMDFYARHTLVAILDA